MLGYFVTGTDTGVGKTVVSAALMHALRRAGASVAGFKPVASGCVMTPEGLRNADALTLQQAASVQLPYQLINPYAFAPPAAPHLAAALAGVEIDLSAIRAGIDTVVADRIVVEGVGGWLVPLTARETVADLAVLLGLPVLLVVGLRLGCINHALLTLAAIRASGVAVAGWVANTIDPGMLLAGENLESLRRLLDVPFLGALPWRPAGSYSDFADHLLLER